MIKDIYGVKTDVGDEVVFATSGSYTSLYRGIVIGVSQKGGLRLKVNGQYGNKRKTTLQRNLFVKVG